MHQCVVHGETIAASPKGKSGGRPLWPASTGPWCPRLATYSRVSQDQGSSSSVTLIGGSLKLPKWTWPSTFRNSPSPPTIGSVSGAPLAGDNPVVLISPRPANEKTTSHKRRELFARVSVHAPSTCPIFRPPAAFHICALNAKLS